jgi:hypothetical protein
VMAGAGGSYFIRLRSQVRSRERCSRAVTGFISSGRLPS